MPPPTATDEADNAPASAAPTCSVEALIVVPLAPEVPDNSLAVTVLDLPVMATEAPIAAIPPLPPPADTLWVEESSAPTTTPAPPEPVTEPPSSAVTVLVTLPTATAASAPKYSARPPATAWLSMVLPA